MKKLMLAMTVVAAAFCSQAASYTWKAATSYTYTDATKATKAAGTAYLFDAGAYSQETLIAAIVGGSTLTDIGTKNALYTSTMASGQVKLTDSFTYDGVAAGNTWSAYFAVLTEDGLIYVSTEKPRRLMLPRQLTSARRQLLRLQPLWISRPATRVLAGIRLLPFLNRRAVFSFSSAWRASRFAVVKRKHSEIYC